MKKLLVLALVLLFSSIAFANDDDVIWGYCSPVCDRIIDTIDNGQGNCYHVYECIVREYVAATDECVDTDETTNEVKTFVCPRPPVVPPYIPLPIR